MGAVMRLEFNRKTKATIIARAAISTKEQANG
jgi:hypothetical protein